MNLTLFDINITESIYVVQLLRTRKNIVTIIIEHLDMCLLLLSIKFCKKMLVIKLRLHYN